LSDHDLVGACLSGDGGAWETLIHRYERLLYSIPLRCGLSEEDAADVFQTVCVKLLENLDRLRDHERLAAWLIVTASRESWRVQRQNRRNIPFPHGDPDEADSASEESLVSTDPLPDEVVARLEEEQMVREAMCQLNERCRALLGCLYYADPPLSYAEIARHMGMPEGSIGPARARCLTQLKRILEGFGF
jgi:RNA polymerase sigma factor (sigma-70 family)